MNGTLAGALVIDAARAMIAMAQQPKGPTLIAGEQPVTEEQVRQKLESSGWSDARITA
jgi:hypothetical protein